MAEISYFPYMDLAYSGSTGVYVFNMCDSDVELARTNVHAVICDVFNGIFVRSSQLVLLKVPEWPLDSAAG